MNKATRQHLWYIFFGIVLVIFITAFLYYTLHPVTKQVIPIDVTVGDYTGINLDSDAIHFGTLKPGSMAQRPVILRADEYAVEITLLVEDIPFVFPENSTITLQKGQNEAVRLFAVTDILTPQKKYEGRLLILTKKL